MANRTGRSTKSVLKPLHTWIGIISGLFLVIVSITGSLIVFRGEFERAAFPRGAATPGSQRVNLEDAAGAMAHFRPNATIRRVRLPLAESDPYIFQVESAGRTERIVLDASSGRVLGTLQTGTMDWVVDLHRNLLSGKQGRTAVGVLGIVLLILSATGVWMWLAGPRRWSSWVSVRKEGSSRRFHFELHRATGLWAYCFLALISFTGMERAFPDAFRGAISSLTGKPATVRAPRLGRTESTRPLDDYLRIGRAAMADGVPIELRLPPPGRGAVDLRLYRAGDLSPSGNHVYLDPGTARVIQVDRIVDRPAGARFLAALAPLHYGQFGGMPVKIAWALLGLTPVLLLITGLIAWWRPAKRTVKQAAAEETGSEDLALAGQ